MIGCRFSVVAMLLTLLLLLLAPLALAKTIEVPKDFATIQAAVNAADPGDLILVSPGSYRENIIIRKSLELRGSGAETIVDGSAARSRPTIWVQDATNVIIQNLTITKGRRGIQVDRSSQILIAKNIIQANRRQGILITENSHTVEIRENQILDTQPDEGNILGNGIILNSAKDARLSNNLIARSAYSGIRLLSATAHIEGNILEENNFYGMEIWPNWIDSPDIPSQAVITHNILKNNVRAGIFITEESIAQLRNNQIVETRTDRDGRHGHALWVTDGSIVTLEGNALVRSQGHGLFAPSGRVTLSANTLSESTGCGLRIEDGAWLSLAPEAKLALTDNRSGEACGTARLLEPAKSLALSIVATQTGSLKAQALTLTQEAALLLALFGPGQESPYAQVQHPEPLKLSVEVSPETLALGTRWRAVVENRGGNSTLVLLQTAAPFRLGSCSEITSEFGIQLFQIDGPPFSERQCNIIYSSLKAVPEAMRRTTTSITNNPSDPQIAGSYTGGGRINLFGPMLRRTLAFVFIHELGHAVQDRLVSRELNARWRELHRRSGDDPDNFVSDYAQTNQAEDFAETFAHYVEETLELLKIARERAARNKTVLLEKVKLIFELFGTTRADGLPAAFIYQLRMKSDEEKTRLALRRTEVGLDAEGLPKISEATEWEEF
ncbi:right-handed parallel beta-helix repeat-containing protein [Candidatus Acetothermia bacterium]|nr:right-handed parallel beta-helix repeat-containing protein [Candidatus Acetothermia bacterium]MCI2431500.1 right-handed parallel beta-helix repeat-containing protein [Candidatus Acetothermia bacterium]MCI2436463.1 right-handed parallel beta-helix repeat-containing protein [Candidatus Acetothermia bacterium]